MSSLIHVRFALTLVTLTLGCSSSPSSSNDGTVAVTGARDGASLSGLDNALGAVVTTSKGTGLDVVLTEGATCADFTAGDTAGATYFELFFTALDGSGDLAAPTAPGSFNEDPSVGSAFVEGDVAELGSDCAQTASGQFATGTVTITSLSGGVVAGSIDLANDTDTASGTFTTVACPGVAARAQSTGSASCH